MRVLVTGGSGFIGSHIVDRLIELGHAPVIVDDLSTGVDFTNPAAEVHRLTIGRDSIADALAGTDAIIHAAAYADLRQNWTVPEERKKLLGRNVHATIALLEEMPKVPIVMLSTAAIYGARTKQTPVVEGDGGPETIQSPYAASKLAAEAYLAAYAFGNGHPWFAARLVNVVGARSTHGVIGDFVRMAREKGHIHAADNGMQRKSWVHVADVADAVIRMATGGVRSGVYSVTSQERISWWDVIEAMRWSSDHVTFEQRPGGAIGDPIDLHVSGDKLDPMWSCNRSVLVGIKEALEGLSWT